MDLQNYLNEAQRAAVEYIDGPSLVIAGAGPSIYSTAARCASFK